MAFAAFALCPGAVPAPPASQPTGAALPLPPPPPPPSNPWVPDADRDAWAASIYQQLEASPLLSATLDAHLPTVPVILHPSVPRGGEPPPVTARHLGFLRVDLSGETPGPGRFFPLFPAGEAAGYSMQLAMHGRIALQAMSAATMKCLACIVAAATPGHSTARPSRLNSCRCL